jgi:protocadherin Fat 1/2/3
LHEIKLEREGNSARLVVDGKHIASGSAPGVNGVLNLQTDDIYFGAEVRPHIEIIGYENIERGYIGCMDDIRISKVPIPLAAGVSSVTILKRLTNVEFGCDHANVLVPLGVCGTQPCYNGGSCEDIGNGNFNCKCDGVRFSGPFCRDDLEPCASSPCLYGGKCRAVINGTYHCECPPRMTGKRCDYGRFCLPNPCLNGGLCEEGDDAPLCMCRGFQGPTCEVDVDECEKQPCGNGATCINEAGSFRCVCPPNVTGASCGDPLYSNSIITKINNLSSDVWFYIILGFVVFLLILMIIMIVCCCWCRKKKSRRHPKNNIINDPRKEILLKPISSDNSQYKRGSKMSNLEAVQRGGDCSAQRPVSYTPSSNNETSPYVYNALLQYNNLDTLRSYGSAGDELENVPMEYRKRTNVANGQQQININTGGSGGANNSSSTTDSDSLHKQKWGDPMHVQLVDNKINNGKCSRHFFFCFFKLVVSFSFPARLETFKSNTRHRSNVCNQI